MVGKAEFLLGISVFVSSKNLGKQNLYLLYYLYIPGIPLPATEDPSQYFPRIMGGEEATKGAAPHMVVSEYITMLVCGASIVSCRHLLTAAHCVDIFVISGELLQ